MNINELTVGELKEIDSLLKRKTEKNAVGPYRVGKPYFIRTVTHHYTGNLVKVFPHEIVLKDAAWIADDGRFATTAQNGEFSEVEPFPDGEVVIGRGAILDAYVTSFPPPRKQK